MDQVQISVEANEAASWRQRCYDRVERLKALEFPSSPDPPSQQLRLLEEETFEKKNTVIFELRKAIQNEEVDKFVEVLEKVCSEKKLHLSSIFDQVTPVGDSLLHEASYFGKAEIAELIGHHFPELLTKTNDKGDTPLHVAARAKSPGVIKVILSQYDAHTHRSTSEKLTRVTNEYGNTALHEAVGSKHVEGVTLLFEADQSVAHSLNKSRQSPLYLAVLTSNNQIVDILLQAPFPDDEPLPKCHGNSPLHAAIYAKNAALMKEILTKKPELTYSRDEDGGTPLHYAAVRGYVEGVRILLDQSPLTALVHNAKGHLPIHLACKWGCVGVVKDLLKQEWAHDLRVYANKKGQNILHVAAKNGQHRVVNYILKNTKVEHIINDKDKDGNTPLHLASQNPFSSIVFSLTGQKEIDLNLMNNEGSTARDTLWLQNEEKMPHELWLSKKVLDSVGAVHSEKASSMIRKRHGVVAAKVEWKDRMNTLMVVAVLIATVTFAALFTVPGGVYSPGDNNVDPDKIGTAVFAKKKMFQYFVDFDGAAMFCSIIALFVLMLAQFSDFQLAEMHLVFAFLIVGVALIYMSLAFLAADYLLTNAISAIALISSVFFLYLLGIFPVRIPAIERRLFSLVIAYHILLYGTPPKLKVKKPQNSASQHAATQNH